MRMDVAKLFDPKKNPFFEHAEARYFLAARDGRTVGRIAAISPDTKGDVVVGVSPSGDLAYSYGSTFFYDTPRHQAKLVFFRIWRKEASGEWKVCLDLELPATTPS